MYIRVNLAMREPSLELYGTDDLERFHVEVNRPLSGATMKAADEILRHTKVGRIDGDRAYIRTEALVQLAGNAATEDWVVRFGQMTWYAEKQGWVSPDGELAAHLVAVW